MTHQAIAWSELRRNLSRYVKARAPADSVEDIVHDILLKILKNQAGFSSADNPVAWIRTVARNALTDYFRKRVSTDKNDPEEYARRMADEKPDASLTGCLLPLINRLEPKYRDALLLADIEGIKQIELARQLGMSVSGLKSRVQRARTQLKVQLLACCNFELDRFGKVIDYEKKYTSDGGNHCC